MVVGCDVDGVLASFNEAFLDLLISLDGLDLVPEWVGDKFPEVWHWPQHYGYSKETVDEAWDKVKSSLTFWYRLKPLPGAEEFLDKLYNSDHEVYFITDRPGIIPQTQTAAWLDQYGFHDPSVIISRGGKGTACKAVGAEVYIDDKPENVQDVCEVSPATITFLMDRPYNQNTTHTPYGRVNTLEEFWQRLEVLDGKEG